MNRVLVTGATGRIGGEVVAGLLAAGAKVRALTRDPAAARLPAGVEVVAGDLTRPESLEAGLDNVAAVFLAWPAPAATAPEVVARVAAHARRIVLLSPLTGRRIRSSSSRTPCGRYTRSWTTSWPPPA